MACGRRGGSCRRIGLCRLLLLIVAAWQAGLFLETLQTRHLQSSASAHQRQRGLNNVSAAVWPIVARLDAAGPGVSWTSSFPPPAPAVDWWRLLRTHVGPAFIYSAFFDPRGPGPPKIRIIAALPSRYRLRPFYCDLKTDSGVKTRVLGKHRPIRENWGLPYTASFIICELHKKIINKDLPAFVSLGDPKRNITSRPLTVHYPPPKINNDKNSSIPFLTVCIKPLHFRYDRALWLIEFIEMYKLLGANHFVFYNKSIGESVSKVLHHYANEHLVSLLPWNLPLRSQRHIRTEGLFAALNDCSYRAMHRFQYAALVDLDEFLIPRKHLNLTRLMAEIDPPPRILPPRYRIKADKHGKRRVPAAVPTRAHHGAFLFRNAFFYLYWENDTNILHKTDKSPPYLLSLAKTRRLAKIHKSGVRSKYIVKPQDVVELGNHVVWEFAPGRSAFTVPEDLALSHHYRICEFGGFECTRQPSVRDRAAHRYAPVLLKRVKRACNTIFPELHGDCPPAPPLGSPW